MLTTRACTLLGIAHPVVLGGMAEPTTPELVATVSEAGGLGIHATTGRTPNEVARLAGAIREHTARTFGLNLLLFRTDEATIDGVLATRPAVFSDAWAAPDQDLGAIFARAHAIGATVMYQAASNPRVDPGGGRGRPDHGAGDRGGRARRRGRHHAAHAAGGARGRSDPRPGRRGHRRRGERRRSCSVRRGC